MSHALKPQPVPVALVLHVGTAWANAHDVPHAPQLPVVRRSTSQPLAAERSQSPYPGSHTAPQTPPEQVTPVAPPPTEHDVAHAPQWFASVARSTSQPLVGSLSQSVQPVSQARPHTPAEHVGAACGPHTQAL